MDDKPKLEGFVMPGGLDSLFSPVLPSHALSCSPSAGSHCPTQPSSATEAGKDPSSHEIEPNRASKPQNQDKPRWKKYLHCGMGILGGIAAWDIYYNIDLGRGIKGWFGKYKLENYRNIGFDRNKLFINRVGHAIGGTGYNLSCQVLGDLPELESALGTFLGSLVFELGAEEAHPSANDHPYTSLVGPAIGGTLNLFFRYFPKIKTNLNLSRNFLGTEKDPKHHFDWFLGGEHIRYNQGESSNASQNFKTELNAEVTRIPGQGRQGKREGWIQGNKAELTVSLGKDEHGISDVDVRTQAALIGRYREHLTEKNSEHLSGYQMYLGVSTAFDYRQHFGRLASPEDNLGAGSVGLMADFGFLTGAGLTLRLRADLLADFAMSTPYAFEKWTEGHSTQDIKPVLEQGYYYGIGRTARTRVTTGYRGYELGVQSEHQHIDSIEGFSRNQGNVRNDIDLVDTRIQGRLWISRIYGNFKIAGEISHLTRKGRVEAVHSDAKALRAGLKLGITF